MKERPDDFDLNAFLQRYGLFIYTGDPEGDLLLIEDEIRELYQLGIIDKEEMVQALAALRKRKTV
ncbi:MULTISPECIES: YqgQ family protein [Bacillales]|uniref:DUF910 domain-containing protein n=1 Tax=Brevibacillus aydinogluensis TaxID=927786 RepID=A0AA48RBI3_9BACL|nr:MULTISPECIES: YqgQ family protein [Bacillales]REK65078.1 MAG: DUF910 domain-containing protein [Brevibacillus sp.]MBR8661622.1 DUF910 family protein [Brevibacillus sp. NL20B1]MDT3415932.1 uncharacterized protein YqgQ [Brevibacillus aydinogluensis]NNV03145.1 DUF910 family protein [Brevibacillus sp. MCWH]UFJ61489.1 DUF910 family protein [Anoxybacillus sediminis]